MKGTLHKTKNGWHVINMQATLNGPLLQSLPILDHGYVNGPGLSDSDEGQEVDFEIIKYPNPPHNPTYHSIDVAAKLIGKWITMKEGDITVNFKPMPDFDDPKYPDYPTRAQQIHIQIAEECFRKYPNNKELYTTDELIDAYKAGVIDGLKEWTLDIYDRPKYPEVKIICPRCKAIMPCPCNLTWYDIMAESNSHDDSEILAYIIKNYNPPTKKQE